MLFSRLVLFAFFQLAIAMILSSWIESEKYWLLIATLTNIISIALLILLLKREGNRYLALFHFNKNKWVKDLLVFLGLVALSIPLVLLPSALLSQWLWGNDIYFQQILFQPLPVYLMYFLLVAFPVTIAFAELATYFGYIMPRLKNNVKHKWIALLLPVIFLSLQHSTLPLVFDLKFIIFRGITYLPFALMLGISLYKRPSLLPYLAILHGLLDFMTVMMLLQKFGNI